MVPGDPGAPLLFFQHLGHGVNCHVVLSGQKGHALKPPAGADALSKKSHAKKEKGLIILIYQVDMVSRESRYSNKLRFSD
jgi:hypothetical protein